jgi:hypothetical protein
MSVDIEIIKELMSFDDLRNSFSELFVTEFGGMKVREIVFDVERSDKAKRFLADSLYSSRRYDYMSFIGVIQTGRRFLLKKADVVCFASIVLLQKWKVEVGDTAGLSDERYLKRIFFEIIAQCDKYKTHTSGIPNVFERYYAILFNVQRGLEGLVNANISQPEVKGAGIFTPKFSVEGQNDQNSSSGVNAAPIDDLPF